MAARIEFDPEKDAANREKHGVSLAFGERVLEDPESLDVLDVRFEYAEERCISYGMVEGRVCVAVYAKRGRRNRFISVRKANDREAKKYEESPRAGSR